MINRDCSDEIWGIHTVVDIWIVVIWVDRLCGLVVRAAGYRSKSPGSIPGATSFSDK
jgi:hypothetical protein